MAEQPTTEKEVEQQELLPPAPPEADGDALDPELAVPRGQEVVSVLEALLFAATQPLNAKKLSVLMNGVPEPEIEEGLTILRERCLRPTSGLVLMEVAGGWQLATRPEVADWVLRLHKHRKKNTLTPSLLESLAIIAYKQPITRADVEAIRGVDCGTALRSLQDAGLCEVVGRKEVIGRPPLYGTTELFLKTFGLMDLENLPSLGEFKNVLAGKAEETGSGVGGKGSGEPSAAEAEGATQATSAQTPEEPSDDPDKNLSQPLTPDP